MPVMFRKWLAEKIYSDNEAYLQGNGHGYEQGYRDACAAHKKEIADSLKPYRERKPTAKENEIGNKMAQIVKPKRKYTKKTGVVVGELYIQGKDETRLYGGK